MGLMAGKASSSGAGAWWRGAAGVAALLGVGIASSAQAIPVRIDWSVDFGQGPFGPVTAGGTLGTFEPQAAPIDLSTLPLEVIFAGNRWVVANPVVEREIGFLFTNLDPAHLAGELVDLSDDGADEGFQWQGPLPPVANLRLEPPGFASGRIKYLCESPCAGDVQFRFTPIPEPATATSLGLALVGLGLSRSPRRARVRPGA